MTNLSPDELRVRIKSARNEEERGEHLCCQYLGAIDDSRCYLTWGYASVRQFADAELGLTPRQVNERLRIARALRSLPALAKALETKELSFSAVREITRVATRASERDWVEAARGASAREIERLVSSSRDGEVPVRSGFGLPRNAVTVSFQVTPEQLALLEAAREQLASETGTRATLAAVILAAVEERWRTEPARRSRRLPRRTVPQLVYVKCPDCASAAVHTDDGLVPVAGEVIASIEPQAEVTDAGSSTVGHSMVEHEPSTPWAREVSPHERDLPATDALRHLVLARDGRRCRVPRCASRLDLQVHHIRWLRHGGRTHAGNLVTVCSVHHAIIHDGGLVLHGTAPHRVRFLTRVWQRRAIESSA